MNMLKPHARLSTRGARRRALGLAAGLALGPGLAACGTDDGSSTEIADTPLTGSVAGAAWTFVAGHTNAFLSEGEPDFFAALYPAAFTACGFSEPDGNHLIVSIPKTVGEYEMGTQRNMTYVVGPGENLVTFEGRIVVEEVTATTVKGGLVSSYDADNEVSGRFEVTICAE